MFYSTLNPVNQEILSKYEYAELGSVFSSIEQLQKGFENWSKLSVKQRQNQLLEIIPKLRSKKNEIAQSISLEMGKPFFYSLAEVQKSMDVISYLVQTDHSDLEDELKGLKKGSHLQKRKPKGVILGIMPWNYPLWQSVRMLFPALLSGNVVLIKSSEIAPSATQILQDIFKSFGLDSIFQHKIFSHDLTEKIIHHPLIKGVSLTGSTQAGKKISEIASHVFKKVTLELGGSDPYFVFADAELDTAAKIIARARLQNSGQSCIACKRVFIDAAIEPEFLKILISEFDKYEFTERTLIEENSYKLGPLAHARFQKADQEMYEKIKKYCEIIYLKSVDQNLIQNTNSYPALRILKIKQSCLDLNLNEVLQDLSELEFFSPTLLVLSYSNLDQALKMANSSVFGLGAAIFSRDKNRAFEFSKKIESGMIAYNSAVQSQADLPFGGLKNSGFGHELGHLGFLEFTDVQIFQNFNLNL